MYKKPTGKELKFITTAAPIMAIVIGIFVILVPLTGIELVNSGNGEIINSPIQMLPIGAVFIVAGFLMRHVTKKIHKK